MRGTHLDGGVNSSLSFGLLPDKLLWRWWCRLVGLFAHSACISGFAHSGRFFFALDFFNIFGGHGASLEEHFKISPVVPLWWIYVQRWFHAVSPRSGFLLAMWSWLRLPILLLSWPLRWYGILIAKFDGHFFDVPFPFVQGKVAHSMTSAIAPGLCDEERRHWRYWRRRTLCEPRLYASQAPLVQFTCVGWGFSEHGVSGTTQ